MMLNRPIILMEMPRRELSCTKQNVVGARGVTHRVSNVVAAVVAELVDHPLLEVGTTRHYDIKYQMMNFGGKIIVVEVGA
jgi:hypothetical protein